MTPEADGYCKVLELCKELELACANLKPRKLENDLGSYRGVLEVGSLKVSFSRQLSLRIFRYLNVYGLTPCSFYTLQPLTTN